jgi:hypothetical protein
MEAPVIPCNATANPAGKTLLSDRDFVELDFPREPFTAAKPFPQVLLTVTATPCYYFTAASGYYIAAASPNYANVWSQPLFTVDLTTNPSTTVSSTTVFQPRAEKQQIYEDIQKLYLSSNTKRDRQIAKRLTALYGEAVDEYQQVVPESVSQFTDFFLSHPDASLPKITLTPDGTVRVRWIHGSGSFVAVEFTGKPLAKLVAEVPREHGETSKHFSSELLDNIPSLAQAIGASFT